MDAVITINDARDALGDLVKVAKAGDVEKSRAGVAWLTSLNGQDLLRVDESARSGWASIVVGSEFWNAADLSEPTGLVTSLLSLHADGRCRERAIRRLGQSDDDLVTALLAVRCGDWVKPVRERALLLVLDRSTQRQAEIVLGVLLAGRDRANMSAALERYVSAVVAANPGIATRLSTESEDRLTRRWAYQYLLTNQALTPQRAAQALTDKGDKLISSWCAHYLARVADPTMMASMLESGSSETRLIALQNIADDRLGNAELERVLLDRSRRIRQAAQWKAKRLGFDMASFYRARLAKPSPSHQQAAAAVSGVAATGSLVDAPLLHRFLTDPTPAV
jgi:hypothetical protein